MPLPPPPRNAPHLLSPDAHDAPARSRTARSGRRASDRRAEEPVQRARAARAVRPPRRGSRRRRRGAGRACAEAPSPAPTSRQPRERRRPPVRSAPQQPARAKRSKPNGPAKLFVLDTNVLMHDPMCLFRFEEHDIFLPMITLEELDGHKKGMTEVARNARQVSRDARCARRQRRGADIGKGLQLDTTGHREAGGKLFFQTAPARRHAADRPAAGQGRQPDPRRRAGAARPVRQDAPGREAEWCWCPRTSTCASRRARWAWPADDYQNDKTLEDGDLLYTGVAGAAGRLLGRARQDHRELAAAAAAPSTASAVRSCRTCYINQFVYLEAPGEPPLYARVTEITRQDRGAARR